jgi:hypothetical protein
MLPETAQREHLAIDRREGTTDGVAPARQALFPLPLTPLEYYYLSDDSADYPMVFPVDLKFSGELDRAAFSAALAEVRERHPLFDALVDRGTRVPQWVKSGGREPFFDWNDETVPITHPRGEFIDLATEIGLRVWVRTGPAKTRVLLHVHHACSDGMATLRFIEELLHCYAKAAGHGDAAPLGATDIEKLHKRGYFAATEQEKPTLRIALRDILITASEWSSILLRKPALLAVPRPEAALGHVQTGDPVRPGASSSRSPRQTELIDVESCTLNRQDVARLQHVASSRGVTLNDVLLRDAFLALRLWNGSHGGDVRHPIRLNVPVNLRERGDEDMPATNRIGFAFVTDQPRNAPDPQTLLAAVREQTDRIKNWKLGLYFLGGLAIARGLPGAIPWSLRRQHSFATMVHSNLGRIFARSALARPDGRLAAGNVVFDRLVAVPPVRRLTHAGFLILEYAGELTICLRGTGKLFDSAANRVLLDAYVRQLRETIERGT